MTPRPFVSLAILALLAASTIGLVPAAAYHDDPNVTHVWGEPAFQRTWERTDAPVLDGAFQRTWIWGPEPFTGLAAEQYAESPGGLRLTQYSDKSRMEINDPAAPDDGVWYVTNGLLVVELMDGLLQVGESAFQPHPSGPATANVAGDQGPGNGPTYAALGELRTAQPHTPGSTITSTVDTSGQTGSDSQYLSAQVTAVDVDAPTNHTVASVFWAFMNSTGPVWVDGQFQTAPLFVNPFYATGFPITEAYWSRVRVGGTEQAVLLQCFERRCLTYTPGNTQGWQVEAGNVGQHYYRWRYGDAPEDQPARLFIADLTPTTKGALAAAGPTGRAAFFLDDTGQSLRFHLTWHGTGNLTAAHIHMGAAGQDGDIIYTLIMGNLSAAPRPLNTSLAESAQGQISSDLLPPGTTLEDLLELFANGQAYVDIHTQEAPAGALRGQIAIAETLDFSAILTNDQEVVTPLASQPDTGANGVARLHYTRADAAITCAIEVDGLANVTMAHIHIAPAGGNGPPVAWLFPAAGPPAAEPPVTPNGSLPCNTITDEDVSIPAVLAMNIGGASLAALAFQMMTANAYVNIHTSDWPDGELRGQLYIE